MAQDIFNRQQGRDMGTQFVSLQAGEDDTGIFYYETENAIASVCLYKPVTGWSSAMGDAVTTLLGSDYPGGTLMQFQQWGIPNLEQTVSEYLDARDGVTGDESVIIAREAAIKRADYLRSGTTRRLLPTTDTTLTDSLCAWTLKIPLKFKNPLSPGNERKFKEACDHFLSIRQQCLTQLEVAGIRARVAGRGETMALLRRYFNMYGRWDAGVCEDEALNEQLFPVGSSVDWESRQKSTLLCKNFDAEDSHQHVGILTIDRFPDESRPWHMSQMGELLGDPSGSGPQPGMPYMLSTTIHFPNQDAKRSKFRANQTTTERAAGMPGALKFSPRLRSRLQSFRETDKMILQGGNLVEVNMSMCLFAQSRRKLRAALSRMAAYHATKGFVMRQERFIPAISFLNNMPMNPSPVSIRNTHRFKTMPSILAAHLLPIMDEWQGYGNRMLLTTRRGKVFRCGIFDKNNTNFNALISAKTGAGKSFFSQRLTQDELSLGTKVWTIDKGSSYVAAARAAGAQIIDLHPDSNICLNPFTNITDIEREMELIAPILGKMAKPNEGLDDLEMALMMEAIQSVYTAKVNAAEITDVIQYLQSQAGEMKDIQHRLAMLLMPFGSTGSMGRWFRGRNNLRTEADWTVLELSGLATNKHLHDVVLMMLATTVTQEMFVLRDGRRRLLVLEECGDLLKDPSFAAFVAQLVSKVRKEDGAVVPVVQTFNQVFQTKHGHSIFAGLYSKFMLEQTQDVLAQAEKEGWYRAPAWIANLLRSVHTAKGQYSEVCVIAGEERAGIARLIETPFNRVMFSTEGDTFRELQRRVRAGEDVVSLIQSEAERLYGDGTYD